MSLRPTHAFFCPQPARSVYPSWVLFAEEIAKSELVAPNSVMQSVGRFRQRSGE
jgi:hypothetical protein